MSDVQLSRVDLPHLIGGHHNLVKDAKSGEDIHVYAITGPPVFGGPSERIDFYIQWTHRGVTYTLYGYIDYSKSKVEICVTLTASFGPFTYTLVTICVDFSGGSITVKIDVRGITGTLKIFIKDGWLWIELCVTIGDTTTCIIINLIPLPTHPHLSALTYVILCFFI
ncbi:hypothetical protein BJV74DRAFT_889532 [Russula compacta]|nr:hypothetical protein BJV74DRAFT_889532 [Russula compacta]